MCFFLVGIILIGIAFFDWHSIFIGGASICVSVVGATACSGVGLHALKIKMKKVLLATSYINTSRSFRTDMLR